MHTCSQKLAADSRLLAHMLWPKLLRFHFDEGVMGAHDLMHATSARIYFFILKPEGRYGPREAWAHMGWVGHPPH